MVVYLSAPCCAKGCGLFKRSLIPMSVSSLACIAHLTFQTLFFPGGVMSLVSIPYIVFSFRCTFFSRWCCVFQQPCMLCLGYHSDLLNFWWSYAISFGLCRYYDLWKPFMNGTAGIDLCVPMCLHTPAFTCVSLLRMCVHVRACVSVQVSCEWDGRGTCDDPLDCFFKISFVQKVTCGWAIDLSKKEELCNVRSEGRYDGLTSCAQEIVGLTRCFAQCVGRRVWCLHILCTYLVYF